MTSSVFRLRTYFMATALGLVVAGPPALAAQSIALPQEIGTPPPREGLRQPAPPSVIATWEAEPFGPDFREAPIVAHPVFVTPDTGIGLPPDQRVHEDQEAPRHKRRLIDPIRRDPNLETAGPVSDDSSVGETHGPLLSQPLMQNFEAIGFNGLTPPDCDAAAGYDYVVCVTNDDFTVFDRCGNVEFTSDIHDYLGISTGYLLFDPKVIFDPWNGRWVMLWHKRDTSPQESGLIFVITAGSTPFGLTGSGAYYYDFNAQQDTGTGDASWADYWDLGYTNNFVTAGGNMFRFSGSFRWARIWTLDKAQIYNALSASVLSFSNLTNADGSTTSTPRAVKTGSSWSESSENIDGVWINSRSGGGSSVTLRKLRSAFSSNTITKVDIGTTAYSPPPDAVQPSGATLDTIDCRLMTATITSDNLGANGVELFTSLTTAFSSWCRAHLMKIDPISNVLEFETRFGADNFYYWFASTASDYSGSNFWVFARTANSAGNEPEIRFVDYDQGVFSNSSSLIRDGDGSYGGFRWGDYFGGELDWGDYSANFSIPGRPAKVWLYGEYGKPSDWFTHVGATSVFGQGNLSSVTPTTTYVLTGPPGGPFVPSSRVYTLTNSGQLGLAYEVTSLPTWLSSSVADGQLFPGTTTVTLSVNSAANSLPPGTYNDTVTFSDCFNGGSSYNRAVQLVVELYDNYCTANTNSTGGAAHITATGSASASAGNLAAHASPVPNQAGIFFHASNQSNLAFGCGRLCAVNNTVRGAVIVGSGNTMNYTYNNSDAKHSMGGFVGSSRNFQCWFRDPANFGACGDTYNTSDAMTIVIQP